MLFTKYLYEVFHIKTRLYASVIFLNNIGPRLAFANRRNFDYMVSMCVLQQLFV